MPSMTTWSDRTFYSIAHDGEVCRVSGFDDHGLEHWTLIETGKGFSDRRKQAVTEIMEAIESGHEAGEI